MSEWAQRDRYQVPASEAGRRISPTIVSQFVRLDQCRRYLRLALYERASGSGFLREYGVAPQEITPLLTRSGAEFETWVEAVSAIAYPTRNLAREGSATEREPDNEEVVATARELPPGETVILFQARLRAALDGWDMTGDADIVRMERDAAGRLHVLVADMKATTTAKVEHRLQVAFYREMLERLFVSEGIAHEQIAIGILYRGGASGDEPDDPQERARLEREMAEARRRFGIDDAYLELAPDPEAYRDALRGLVTAPGSVARQAIETPFAAIPWHLTSKCDGCLYNEFCMKWAAEHDDCSLLPHLTEHEKRGLLRAGIDTTRELATLMEPVVDPETGEIDLHTLRPAPGREATVGEVARTWPVGPRLEELVHRARRYRRWRGDDVAALSYIPSKGYGSLPHSDAAHNPNLVRIFIDAQHDYLHDRIYLIGSLVVANDAGVPDSERRRAVVRMAHGPPDDVAERELLTGWIDATIRALAEVAAPDANGRASAPIHLIFWNGFGQRLLLEALSRHARSILTATPLYDFITQMAAFDSPVATFLDREIRELRNYPILCQSLQAVAMSTWPGGVRFDWNAPEPFREIFRERLFDALGRIANPPNETGQGTPWATRRARFNSQIPLEYAYAAWGELPAPPDKAKDPYGPYRRATTSLLTGFQHRRLEAMEHIAADFQGNRDTTKTNFLIPDLSEFDGKAQGLAEALMEFVTIERHVDLAAWKSARLAPPERRVLAGDALLVRYLTEDQLPEVAEAYAENQRRAALKEKLRQEFLEKYPDAAKASYTPEQQAATKPLPLPGPFRLRIDTSDTGVSLGDALALTTLKAGDRLVIEPRWTVDSRLPEAEQRPLTPTPKQMLYGMRHNLAEVEIEAGSDGQAARAWLLTTPSTPSSSNDPPGFLFSGHEEPLIDGDLYSVDPDPNDIFAFWGAKVVQGLLAGEPNELFSRVERGGAGAVEWPAEAAAGQARFMAGLQAMHEAGVMVGFEPSKVEFIGEAGGDPLLLVQGPPGTGKSYTTAFAILARVQGALAAGKTFRVLMGAKTHAATDVLMQNVVGAIATLRGLQAVQPETFADYFDERVLDVPVYRLQPRGDVPEGVQPLYVDKDKRPEGAPRPLDQVAGMSTAIVASTPGGIYRAAQEPRSRMFRREEFELLVLDEASQLSLPESIMAALPLRRDAQIVIVGDHRQMAPIVKHDWENETRRTFADYAVYRSLFETVRTLGPRMIQFEQSFRLDRDMAEFLRRTIYAHDGLHYHSQRDGAFRCGDASDDFVAAVLHPEHPLVVVVHDESSSQLRNDFERDLVTPLIAAMHGAGYDVTDGFGLVVPHRAQRASLHQALRTLLDGAGDAEELAKAVDTVERFQGGEREAIVVSATESDPAYLLAAGKFLYDPRRLTVAISRAKDKMVLVASRSVFDLFSPDEETFANAQLWKDLLHRTCTVPLWEGTRRGYGVKVWGNEALTPE